MRVRYRSPLQLLMDVAQADLQRTGQHRGPAGPWIEAATFYLRLQSRCRMVLPHETPKWNVEQSLAAEGLTWAWEGDELVLTKPGWTPPPVRLVAIQPGLFD